MGLDVNSPIELTDKLEDIKTGEVLAQAEKADASNRVEYSLMQTQKRLYELDLKRNRYQFIPSVVGYASLSSNAQRTEFDVFDTDKKWYAAGLIGLTVSLPIIDGFQRNARIQQSKLTLMKMDNSINQLKQGITLEVATAKTNLVNSNTSLETQRKNRELAQEIVRVSKIKYDQGVGSSLEVMDAETSLREAETNYYNAMFDALVSKIELDKALGNIK
jgi:outer membrane protein TolC